MQVDVPASSSAIQSLVEASSGSLEHGWEIGWSLAAHSAEKFKDSMHAQVGLIIMLCLVVFTYVDNDPEPINVLRLSVEFVIKKANL